MSAYIVEPEVIANLARYYAYSSYPTKYNPGRAQLYADILVKENIRSIEYRYAYLEKDVVAYFIGKPEQEYRKDITFILKDPEGQIPTRKEVAEDLIDYDYQACEHPDYEKSKAYKLVHKIAMKFVSQSREIKEGEST